nr:uncharacterized protein LOC116765797 [Danaus plexippus plexippus]
MALLLLYAAVVIFSAGLLPAAVHYSPASSVSSQSILAFAAPVAYHDEADGSIRSVEYSADDKNGFNAVVHNSASTAAPALIKAAPLVLKAPVYATPVPHY